MSGFVSIGGLLGGGLVSKGRKKSNKIIAADLFSGAGGLSLGAKWVGVDVKIAIEKINLQMKHTN